MKFVRSKFECYLVLFMLISSFIIQIHTETTLIRSLNSRFNSRLLRKNYSKRGKSPSKREGEDDSLPIKVFDFILGLLSSLPIIDDFVEKIEGLFDNSEECQKEKLIEAFEEGVAARKNNLLHQAVIAEDGIFRLKNSLVWKPTHEYDIQIHNLESSNPKAACKLIVQEFQRQKEENEKFRDSYKRALAAANQIIRDKISYDDFVKKLPLTNLSIMNTNLEQNYVDLKHFLKRILLNDYKLDSIKKLKPFLESKEIIWEEAIKTSIDLLYENFLMAEKNLADLNKENPDTKICKHLPDNDSYRENKPTFMDNLAGGWNAIKYVGKCFLESLPNHALEYGKDQTKDLIKDFLKELGEQFLNNLVVIFGSTVTNILGFFASKAVKILWWLAKTFYYIYKAIDGKPGDGSIWRWWGKAAGGAIRLIYIAFMPTERRKLKKIKKY